MSKKIDELSDDFKNQICEGCPVSSQCIDRKTRFVQLVNKAKLLSGSLDQAQNSLWNDFSRHLDFLKLNDFADNNGNLTKDGIWASKLRLDQPLIIAELIRKGSLNNLTHELLSSIIAVFVNDKIRDYDTDDSDSEKQKLLRKSFIEITKILENIISLKNQYGFNVPQLQFWPAAAIHSWACGETWEDVIRLTSVDEGDLAMLIFRTADNLRQISSLATTHPELAEKAKESIKHILREPVIIPT
jgi:superfamily II RNA helicase